LVYADVAEEGQEEAMMASKKATTKPSLTERLDALLGDLDPNLAIAMSLASIASFYGVMPPMTALLSALNPSFPGTKSKSEEDNLSNLRDAWEAANELVEASPQEWWAWISSGFSHEIIPDVPYKKPATEAEAKAQQVLDLRYGRAAMAAVEVYLMSRPGVMTALIEAPSKMVAALGEIVPG